MRFRLLEVDKELQSATEILYDKTSGDKARTEALLRYLEARDMKTLSSILRTKKNGYENLLKAIFFSIDSGRDVAQKFELVLKNIRLEQIKPNHYENFVKLSHLINNLNIEINNSSQYLYNPSLYNRRMYDFEYTVKVFAAASDPVMCRKLIGVDKIDVKNLYDGNTILPAGIVDEDESENTIHGVIYQLKNRSENPYQSKGEKSNPKSKFSVYNSIENIDKDEHVEGRIVRIEGDFKFTNGKWVPVKE